MDRRKLLKTLGAGGLLAGFTAVGASAQSSRGLRGYLRTNWSRDPFALGSYSFLAKGSGVGDMNELARPVDQRLYFAGEATTPYASTVHGAYISGQRAAQEILDDGHQQVVIVGAGMSGLSAARALRDAGVAVQLVEGRNRLGGRIWTSNALGAPMDLGASWIHGVNGNPLTDLARQFGARTVVTPDTGAYRGRDGRRIRESDLPSWLEEVAEVQQSIGAGSEQIDFGAYWRYESFDGDEVVFPGGYAQLTQGLAAGQDVRLNARVTGVWYEDDGAYMTVNGEDQRSSAVLVTVPLGVLKAGSINFYDSLPPRKRQAIQRLGMGLLDKVYLQYDRAFWDPQTWILTPETGLPQGQFNQWLNLDGLFGVPIILAFNGAQPARDLAGLSDDEMVRRATSVIESAYS